MTNTPGVLDDATADLTLALILAATRRLAEGDRLVRSGREWNWGMGFMLGSSPAGQRLGIVGLGSIGKWVAQRARAFGMEIAYHQRNPAPAEVEAALGAERMPLERCWRGRRPLPALPADAGDASPDRRRRAGDDEAERGPRQHRARADRRRGGAGRGAGGARIAAAGLDVYEREPQVEPRLLELDNVVLTPHLGSATVETRTAMAELAARNAISVLSGQGPLTPVTQQ